MLFTYMQLNIMLTNCDLNWFYLLFYCPPKKKKKNLNNIGVGVTFLLEMKVALLMALKLMLLEHFLSINGIFTLHRFWNYLYLCLCEIKQTQYNSMVTFCTSLSFFLDFLPVISFFLLFFYSSIILDARDLLILRFPICRKNNKKIQLSAIL